MTDKYDELAARFGFSRNAVETVAHALQIGKGTQAQFNHPELGGMGQWMPGMVMIGDAFNHTLKAKVESLCVELAGLVKADKHSTMPPMRQEKWWSDELGEPSMAGQQNESRYAYFPNLQRLAIMRHNRVRVYNTEKYVLTGVAQQQSNRAEMLVFQTKSGIVSEADLEEITE